MTTRDKNVHTVRLELTHVASVVQYLRRPGTLHKINALSGIMKAFDDLDNT